MPDRRHGHGQRTRDRRHHARRCAIVEPLESRRMLTIVAVYGDIQGSTNAQTTANMVRSWNPESVMLVGDDYYEADGDIDNTIGKYYHDYISPYSGAFGAGSTTGNHVWSALGNHEYSQSPGAANYLNFFTFPSSPANERYYKLSQGNTDW